MALDRLLPVSTTPGAVSGNSYMDAVQEEVTGLWDRARIRLTSVSGTNTITATFVPALTAGLVDGMNAVLRPVANNTGAVTLNGVDVRDGLGNALSANALLANGVYDLHYVSAITAWCIVGYFPTASVAVGMVYLGSITVSGTQLVDQPSGSNILGANNSIYHSFMMRMNTISPNTTNATLSIQVRAGGAFQSTGYAFAIAGQDNGSATQVSNNSGSGIAMTAATVAAGSAGLSGTVWVTGLAQTALKKMWTGAWSYISTGGTKAISSFAGGGQYDTNANAIDGFQIVSSTSGGLLVGTIDIFGVRP